MKKIAFITGTRADYGKIKPIISLLAKNPEFEIHLLATGMHLLSEYGSTIQAILEDNLCLIEIFQNQEYLENLDSVIATTISKLGHLNQRNNYDLIVIHGDRAEALAGAISGITNGIPVAHIEGGELSGNIDGIFRHAISKLSNFHFVANEPARLRLIQLGENTENIFKIGSPDIDVMLSEYLPSLNEVKERYGIEFENYGILLFHPVTDEISTIGIQAKSIVSAVEASNQNLVVIRSNNDPGADQIHQEFSKLQGDKFVHLPSMRFEYFLVLLKSANFILGNSSAGIREAPIYGVPTIDIGSRQRGRDEVPSILAVPAESVLIQKAILEHGDKRFACVSNFGSGNAAKKFIEEISKETFWLKNSNKSFIDISDPHRRV
jgi:UDP-N-acetylglucosamine 2-epimerase (hydrolysing)